jgi:predicted kinase
MMRELTLVRGLPGSGKSTIASGLAAVLPYDTVIFEADDFFYDEKGLYSFKRDLISQAHLACLDRTLCAMRAGRSAIVVSNTFTTLDEMQPYFSLADIYGYKLRIVTVGMPWETDEAMAERTGDRLVPANTIRKMRGRFQDANGIKAGA